MYRKVNVLTYLSDLDGWTVYNCGENRFVYVHKVCYVILDYYAVSEMYQKKVVVIISGQWCCGKD